MPFGNLFAMMLRPVAVFLIAILLAASQAGVRAAEAPAFSLRKFDGSETVKLESFAGGIVVLDFFAYWCGPCQKSAPEIEAKIQKHYEAAGGNAHRVKVTVVSINVEEANPGKTAAFIKRYRPSLVLDDHGGKTLSAYGGEGLPYLVVLDGTKSSPGKTRFEIAHRVTGFPGAAALRKVIDSIQGQTPPNASVEP